MKDRTERKNFDGSLTVEATLCFPICIFFTLIFVYLFFMIRTEFQINQGIRTAMNRIGCATIYEDELKGALSQTSDENGTNESLVSSAGYSVIAREFVISDVGRENLKNRNLLGGSSGIATECYPHTVAGSECLEIKTEYCFRLPIIPGKNKLLPVCNGQIVSLWKGASLEQTDSMTEYVYLTETGTVYHTNPKCRSINVSVNLISANSVQEARNLNGGIYYPCSKCIKDQTRQNYYFVTEHGNRYHSSLSCQGLERNTVRIRREDTDLPLCAYCALHNGEEDKR